MDYENVGKELILEIEQATTDLKLLIKKSLTDFVSINNTRREATMLIDEVYEYVIKYGDDYETMANQTKESLTKCFNEWYAQALQTLKEMGATPFIRNVRSLIRGDDRKGLNAYILNENGKMVKARVDASELRKYITSHKFAAGQLMIDDYKKKMNVAMVEIAKERPTLTGINKNGKRYTLSLRNLAEMKTRYEAKQEDMERLRKAGINLVIASQHVDSSKRCEPWQGRVYSLDGSSGRTKDKHRWSYIPLKVAIDNGFLGYNCRHRVVKYMENMDKPKPIPTSVIKHERKVDATQREYEREILRAQNLEKMDLENSNKWAKTAKQLFLEYQKYSKQNERAFYPWRCGIEKGNKLERVRHKDN